MAESPKKTIIITSIICVTVLLLSAIGVWFYIQQQDSNRATSKEQAIKECSDKILPRAAENLKYADYEKCMAGRGFDGRER
jgi:flagellar basal body-associated protein FliL